MFDQKMLTAMSIVFASAVSHAAPPQKEVITADKMAYCVALINFSEQHKLNNNPKEKSEAAKLHFQAQGEKIMGSKFHAATLDNTFKIAPAYADAKAYDQISNIAMRSDISKEASRCVGLYEISKK